MFRPTRGALFGDIPHFNPTSYPPTTTRPSPRTPHNHYAQALNNDNNNNTTNNNNLTTSPNNNPRTTSPDVKLVDEPTLPITSSTPSSISVTRGARRALELIHPWSSSMFLTVDSGDIRAWSTRKIFDVDDGGHGYVSLSEDAKAIKNRVVRGRILVGVAVSDACEEPGSILPIEWRESLEKEEEDGTSGNKIGAKRRRGLGWVEGVGLCLKERVGQGVMKRILGELGVENGLGGWKVDVKVNKEVEELVKDMDFRERVWEGTGCELKEGESWVGEKEWREGNCNGEKEFCLKEGKGVLVELDGENQSEELVISGESFVEKKRKERELKEKRKQTQKDTLLKRRRASETLHEKIMRVADDAERQSLQKRSLKMMRTPSPPIPRKSNAVSTETRVQSSRTRNVNGHRKPNSTASSSAHRVRPSIETNGRTSARGVRGTRRGLKGNERSSGRREIEDSSTEESDLDTSVLPLMNGRRHYTHDLSAIPEYFLGGSATDSDDPIMDITDLMDSDSGTDELLSPEPYLPRPAANRKVPIPSNKKKKSLHMNGALPSGRKAKMSEKTPNGTTAKPTSKLKNKTCVPATVPEVGKIKSKRRKITREVENLGDPASRNAVNSVIQRVGRLWKKPREQADVDRNENDVDDSFHCESSPSLSSDDEKERLFNFDDVTKVSNGRLNTSGNSTRVVGNRKKSTTRNVPAKINIASGTKEGRNNILYTTGTNIEGTSPTGRRRGNAPAGQENPSKIRMMVPIALNLGDRLNSMTKENEEFIERWRWGDCDWFRKGESQKEILLNKQRITCRKCCPAEVLCEESIIIQLTIKGAWKKLRRITHIGPEVKRKMKSGIE